MAGSEFVVLLSEEGEPIGTADKVDVHTTETPLHLAFSCHVVRPDGLELVTRRALSKSAWPGVWTNAFCGHPAPGEALEDAIARRAAYELGIAVAELRVTLPDFRYRAVDASGIVENEVCPVYTAVTTDAVAPNPREVAEFAWVEPGSLRTAALAAPYAFSPWLRLQLEQLGG